MSNATRIEIELPVINKLGLHARASGKLIEVTNSFTSTIVIGRDGQMVDAKNIMSLLMLGASQGTTLQAIVEGQDAEQASLAVQQIFADKFMEAE